MSNKQDTSPQFVAALVAIILLFLGIRIIVSDVRHDLATVAGRSTASTIKAIETSAHADIGQPLWARTVWAPYTKTGDLGCAAALTVVLWQAGVHIPGSDNVLALANQLVDAGWEEIPITSERQMRKGDVIYGSNSERDSHIGIVGSVAHGVWIYDNNSGTSLWGYHPIGGGYGDFVPGYRFKAGHLWVLRYQG